MLSSRGRSRTFSSTLAIILGLALISFVYFFFELGSEISDVPSAPAFGVVLDDQSNLLTEIKSLQAEVDKLKSQLIDSLHDKVHKLEGGEGDNQNDRELPDEPQGWKTTPPRHQKTTPPTHHGVATRPPDTPIVTQSSMNVNKHDYESPTKSDPKCYLTMPPPIPLGFPSVKQHPH